MAMVGTFTANTPLARFVPTGLIPMAIVTVLSLVGGSVLIHFGRKWVA